MTKNKTLGKLRKILSLIIAVILILSALPCGIANAVSFDTDYVCKDGMQLGYSIVNGYSKLSIEKQQYNDTNRIGAYCGLDVSNLYVLASLGTFYITSGVDLDRAMTDTVYALEKVAALDAFLKNAGIKNERALKYKSSILKGSKKVYIEFDTVGLYVFDSTDERAIELMGKDYVDCVLDGGQAPRNLKDLNMDGKSDKKDAVLIQQYLADALVFDDEDINEYALYVCDINEDKRADIRDVTCLMRKS